jgi:hypothetical protein
LAFPDVLQQAQDSLNWACSFIFAAHRRSPTVMRAGRSPASTMRSASVSGILMSLPTFTVATRRSKTQRRMQDWVTPSRDANSLIFRSFNSMATPRWEA